MADDDEIHRSFNNLKTEEEEENCGGLSEFAFTMTSQTHVPQQEEQEGEDSDWEKIEDAKSQGTEYSDWEKIDFESGDQTRGYGSETGSESGGGGETLDEFVGFDGEVEKQSNDGDGDGEMEDFAGLDFPVTVELMNGWNSSNKDWTHWIYIRERMNRAVDFPSCCSYGPVSVDDPFRWTAAILGPPASPYEDGVFFLSIDLPPDYPNSPPSILFLTKVFHPNIDEDGKIYVNILEEHEWNPVQTIESLLLSICSLMADPDPVDPTFESAYLFRNDWETYFHKAREWTRIYATM